MNPIDRRNAFTFAEIVVAAPWVAALLDTSQDNDKADMLQRNRWTDEGSPAPDALSLEAAARRERAAFLVALVNRLRNWLRSSRDRGVHAARA